MYIYQKNITYILGKNVLVIFSTSDLLVFFATTYVKCSGHDTNQVYLLS